MDTIELTTPLSAKTVKQLKAGDRVLISGKIYAARDAAHRRMIETLEAGGKLPVDFEGQIIYYVGPCPAKPGEIIGSAGPTASRRMDAYASILMEHGLKGMIGNGNREERIINSMMIHQCVYFGSVGGAGALLQNCIKSVEILAYEDLGTEAVRKLVVEDFPALVVIDAKGNNLYETEQQKYANQYID